MISQTQLQWRLRGRDGLELFEDAPIPTIGHNDVLGQIHAASLNFRDLMINKGVFPLNVKDNVVPLSDGVGVVVAAGAGVTRFKLGDKVVTLFSQGHLSGTLTEASRDASLGGSVDGILQQFAAFNEQNLVEMPQNPEFYEGATLPCAALTAWSALYSSNARGLKQGDAVLTEGTGGVSTFAVQFAKSAGAQVIATTSSNPKAEHLKALGAGHVINYKQVAEWGQVAKSLTLGQKGVSSVVEVGGPTSLRQALRALQLGGVVSMVGVVGGLDGPDEPRFMECIAGAFSVRGVTVGSRQDFEDMNRAIEVNNIKPIVDERVFGLKEAKEAFQYLETQQHVGKIVMQIA